MEIDHDYTTEVVCPHCGYTFSDSWEFFIGDFNDAEIECECGQLFYAYRDVDVSYCTVKLEPKESNNG